MFEDYIEGFREIAEADMNSRVDVRRRGANTTQDESTGSTSPAWEVVLQDSPFRLAGAYHGDSPSRSSESGGVDYEAAVRTAKFPAGTTALRDGDLIDIREGEWAGRVFRIIESTGQDRASALRLPVVETSRPTEWG